MGELPEIVAFHAQQATEKYLNALLTFHKIEFPETHIIAQLLFPLKGVEPELAEALDEAHWLRPFAVEVRYPGDGPQMIEGHEVRAMRLAGEVRERVMAVPGPYLAGD
jgi:HEPN domain-containing protein